MNFINTWPLKYLVNDTGMLMWYIKESHDKTTWGGEWYYNYHNIFIVKLFITYRESKDYLKIFLYTFINDFF